jgi:hypothetical protein
MRTTSQAQNRPHWSMNLGTGDPQTFKVTRRVLPGVLGSKLRVTACRSIARGQEREARPLVVGCSTETGSDAGKVFLRASSSASSWRLRSPVSRSTSP